MNRWSRILVFGAGLLLACSDDEPPSSRPPASLPVGGDAGFAPLEVSCGNGYVEPGEECDLAGREDESCTADCSIPCGLDHAVAIIEPTRMFDPEPVNVAIDRDGTTVMIGQRSPPPPTGANYELPQPGPSFVRTYDPEGETLWQFDVDSMFGLHDVVIDDDTVFVAGRRSVTEGRDLVILSFDRATGAPGPEFPWVLDNGFGFTDLELGPDGSVVALGYMADSTTDQVWLQKRASVNGEVLWTETWGNDAFEFPGQLVVHPDGAVDVVTLTPTDIDSILRRFEAEGGAPTVLAIPSMPIDRGNLDLTIDEADNLYAHYVNPSNEEYIERWGRDNTMQWRIDVASLLADQPDLEGSRFHGRISRRAEGLVFASAPWTASSGETMMRLVHLVADGRPVCQTDHSLSSIDIHVLESSPRGNVLLVEGDSGEVWLRWFRPPAGFP